jgi:DNA topoisomerase VI subunit A
MEEAFSSKLHLNKANQARLLVIAKIIDEYKEQGYVLTLRQLYYQLVSRGIIPNRQAEYSKLSSLLVEGRMAGIIDWDAIEDRLRQPFLPYFVTGIQDAIEDTINYYRLDRQKDQDTYIELWVEKDALSGVLKPITSYYHINLMVNRGYSSCSAIYRAYKRFSREERLDKNIVILYLGDHDPSGLDMIRDIQNRLEEFSLSTMIFEIKHIGLTKEQIEKYNPPPNPAKITDPRAAWYISEHGETSWEVDALNPDVLTKLIRKNVEDLIDMDLFAKQLQQEIKDKKKLEKYMKILKE